MRRVVANRGAGLKIVIPKTVTHGMELIILSRDTYDREVKQGQAIARALQVIAEGEQAYREGRTLKASSLEDALKAHARHAH